MVFQLMRTPRGASRPALKVLCVRSVLVHGCPEVGGQVEGAEEGEQGDGESGCLLDTTAVRQEREEDGSGEREEDDEGKDVVV